MYHIVSSIYHIPAGLNSTGQLELRISHLPPKEAKKSKELLGVGGVNLSVAPRVRHVYGFLMKRAKRINWNPSTGFLLGGFSARA